MMETKLDSRQGQFPATFPDTFKDFFAMMSEDEDHLDLFSNLLEDKVIPRANRFTHRRCGGSLRGTSSHTRSGNTACDSSGESSYEGGGSAGQHNVGRSNSFRMNRPRNVFANSATALNNIGVGSAAASAISVGGNRSGSSGSLFCKHIKYCCLHQQQQQQQSSLKSSNQQLFPSTSAGSHQPQLQQQHQQQQQPKQQHDYDYMGARLGPDGEDNSERCTVSLGDSIGQSAGNSGPYHSHYQHQPQQHQAPQLAHCQKRHSVILERAFDFDTSCDESDTISTTSSTTPACNIPYNILKPILKQPQQQQLHQQHQKHQQQQQAQQLYQPSALAKTMPKDKTMMPSQTSSVTTHRTLPQPPKGATGVYHSRETALQRIQQQSRLYAGSKTNLVALTGQAPATATNITGSGSGSGSGSGNSAGGGCGACVGGVGGSESTGCGIAGVNSSGNNGRESLNNNNHYNHSGSNYNLSETLATGAGPMTAAANSRCAYMELQSPTTSTQLSATAVSKFNNDFLSTVSNSGAVTGAVGGASVAIGGGSRVSGDGTTNLIPGGTGNVILGSASRGNLSNIRTQKSPILNRRRSSSIAANLLTADMGYNWGDGEDSSGTRCSGGGTIPHSSTRDRMILAKSPISNKPSRVPLIPVESGVLTFQQAISGAVSPQYAATSPLIHTRGSLVGGSTATGLDLMGGSTNALASVLEDASSADGNTNLNDTFTLDSPTNNDGVDSPTGNCNPQGGRYAATYGGKSGVLHGSTATIAQLGNKQRQRMRTSSMPAESRKPRLAETRRAAIHCADIDLDYYRLRSFSITSHGVCNLGDSLRSRRSRSINSVTSTGTSTSGKDRNNSNASRASGDIIFERVDKHDAKGQIPAYKVAMLGASGVGKTTLTYQFTTSDYICAYDLSLDDDYGQKTVSVLLDGIETDLEIIDHPACEMSTEAFCSTYNIDLFVVVYSVVDRNSFKAAEKILQYLKENEMLLTRGAILVGNKTDLERHREVNRQMGRKLAKDIACKFIETSSGLDHNVDELLVGIVAQVKLNPQRIRNLSERDRQRLNLQNAIQKHRRMHIPARRMVRQVSMCQADDPDDVENSHHNAQHSDDGDGDEIEERDENQSNNVLSMCDEGIGTGSERTASTSLSSGASKSIASIIAANNAAGAMAAGNVTAAAATTSCSKGQSRKSHKRTLNLESILKMGESEVEDEDDAQRQANFMPSRPLSKFELLTSGMKSTRTPFASANTSPKSRRSNEVSAKDISTVRSMHAFGADGGHHQRDAGVEDNLLDDDCNRKTVSKLTSRTRVFLSSVLRFKKAIHVKRRNSSSCSDLFVI